jgi:hypothetical protein
MVVLGVLAPAGRGDRSPDAGQRRSSAVADHRGPLAGIGLWHC